jgi:hypothetical protein
MVVGRLGSTVVEFCIAGSVQKDEPDVSGELEGMGRIREGAGE